MKMLLILPIRKKLLAVLFFVAFASTFAFAQQNYALVIGNANYVGISTLKNPVNDARDVEAALKRPGFSVQTVLDGDLIQMERALDAFSSRLSDTRNAYGFFFYAGHRVQAEDGRNYFIPIKADSITSDTHLKVRAVSLDSILENLDKAKNELNMVVLDACRNNPFVGWSRSGSRGLSVVSNPPSGSIIMYATSANSKADDGEGRNSPFTSHLVKNFQTLELSVFDVFDKTKVSKRPLLA